MRRAQSEILYDCSICRTPKLDKDDKDPSLSIMKMMKQMYDDGDDEMKRTIAKAWTESREKQASGGLPGF